MLANAMFVMTRSTAATDHARTALTRRLAAAAG